MAKLDVWLPAFNADATIAAAIRSLRRQTFRDVRLIVVDDGSADRTAEIAGDAGATVLRVPHGGIVGALQAAARASDAPIVARMDADDLCARGRFEAQLAVKADLVATRVRLTGPPGLRAYLRWQNGLVTHGDIVREMYVESPIAHPTALFTREIYERAGGYRDVAWPEDVDLWHRMREAGARFAKVPRALVAWRDSPGRLTRTHPMYAPEAHRAAKLHYLLRDPFLRRGPVTVWGAGPIGRRWARDLRASGVEVEQAIDIDRRKIGRRLGNVVPVRAVDEALARRRGPLIGAVGSRGARELIRGRLVAAGMVEGEDFLFVA
jgi:glycosyltransferase involved in cell wall biosynthesis